MISKGMILLLFFWSTFIYGTVINQETPLKVLNDFISDLKSGKLSYENYKKYMYLENEYEIMLEFEYCAKNEITDENCQSKVTEIFGDNSITLKKIYDKIGFWKTKINSIKIDEIPYEFNYVFYYEVQIDENVYFFQIVKRNYKIADIFDKNGKSIIWDKNKMTHIIK